MSAPPSRNRRQQIQLTPEEQAAFLRQHHKAAFATIDKDGFPHVVGMNYFVKDGAFYMTSYGKAQKVVNVRRNPKVGLMVETGDSYAELRGVMVRGHCEIIEDVDTVRAMLRPGRRSGCRGRPGQGPSRARRSAWCSRSSRTG